MNMNKQRGIILELVLLAVVADGLRSRKQRN